MEEWGGQGTTGTNRGTIPNHRNCGPDFIGSKCPRGPVAIQHRSYDPPLDGLERSWCCGRLAHCLILFGHGNGATGLVYATVGVLRLCYPGEHAQQGAQRSADPRYHDRHTKPAPLRRHRGAAKKAKARNKIIYGGAKIAGWKEMATPISRRSMMQCRRGGPATQPWRSLPISAGKLSSPFLARDG